MPDDKQKIDAPSSFWGMSGMVLCLLSISATLILIFGFGLAIIGTLVCSVGLSAGLACIGIGITKNSQAIEDVTATKSISTSSGMPMHIGHTAEKQQTTKKTKDNSQTNYINSENASVSKKMVNSIKSKLLNK